MDLFSIWHWLIVAVIVLLLFGRGKISDVMGEVGQGIKAFKKSMAEEDAPRPREAEPMKAIDHPADGDAPPTDAVRHS
jgi:sec-independent protein translocase protein TatA